MHLRSRNSLEARRKFTPTVVPGSHRLTNALDLVQMKKVVTSVELDMVRQALFAALDMYADSLQVFGCGPADEPEVRSSQNREHHDRVAGI